MLTILTTISLISISTISAHALKRVYQKTPAYAGVFFELLVVLIRFDSANCV